MIAANIVREHDGIPVLYGGCVRGFGVRVVSPQNPKAPSKDIGVTILYLAPGGVLEPHHHQNEEVYIILEGEGRGQFGLKEEVKVEPGMFIHLPSNAEHGIVNTGNKMMKVLLANVPGKGPFGPAWGEERK